MRKSHLKARFISHGFVSGETFNNRGKYDAVVTRSADESETFNPSNKDKGLNPTEKLITIWKKKRNYLNEMVLLRVVRLAIAFIKTIISIVSQHKTQRY